MKFLQFVPCWGASDGEGGSRREAPHSSSVVRRLEETRALVTNRKTWRRKRGRAGCGGNGAEWKPSLGSISEDKVVMVEEKEEGTEERSVKRKDAGSSGGRSRNIAEISRCGNDEDYRRHRYTSVFPAFSPTPFMI